MPLRQHCKCQLELPLGIAIEKAIEDGTATWNCHIDPSAAYSVHIISPYYKACHIDIVTKSPEHVCMCDFIWEMYMHCIYTLSCQSHVVLTVLSTLQSPESVICTVLCTVNYALDGTCTTKFYYFSVILYSLHVFTEYTLSIQYVCSTYSMSQGTTIICNIIYNQHKQLKLMPYKSN